MSNKKRIAGRNKGLVEHWSCALMAHRRFMRQSGKRYPENDVVVGVTK